jgi:hypothetical protein
MLCMALPAAMPRLTTQMLYLQMFHVAHTVIAEQFAAEQHMQLSVCASAAVGGHCVLCACAATISC